jgi:hypothetical protein
MKKRRQIQKSQNESAPAAKTPGPPPTPDEIRRRAHEIFLARGGVPGKELDDWLLAERELKRKETE